MFKLLDFAADNHGIVPTQLTISKIINQIYFKS